MILEPIHAVTYFAPEAAVQFADVGLRGFWRGYFAARASPLGETHPEPVIASFYGFAPSFVRRSIPSVWDACSPQDAVAARQTGAAAHLHGVLADDPQLKHLVTESISEIGHSLRRACGQMGDTAGLLSAANAALEWPEDPLEALWHAATVLREHRGDAHVRALLAADLSPCESSALRSGSEGTSVELVSKVRGWEDEDWALAIDSLIDRGLLEPTSTTASEKAALANRQPQPDAQTNNALLIRADLRITDRGQQLVDRIEVSTDRCSADPLTRAELDVEYVCAQLGPLADALAERGTIPYPNPIGVPRNPAS